VIRAVTAAIQWCGKHASTIEAVFYAWSVLRSYFEDNWRYSAVELQQGLLPQEFSWKKKFWS
jgi:hypothetical protein